MPADIVHEDNPALTRVARKTTPAAALAALGIVYGDLGTSPLYTLQAVVGATGGHFSPEAALGSLSLIFWALIITISVKYCLFVMRADNHGEGGILALMSMTGANWSLIVMGLFGAALLYGDGIITPAISVLSALEGLNVVTDVFKPHLVISRQEFHKGQNHHPLLRFWWPLGFGRQGTQGDGLRSGLQSWSFQGLGRRRRLSR